MYTTEHHISILYVRTVPFKCTVDAIFMAYNTAQNIHDTAFHCPRPVVTE